jgi:hypothetical protein
MLSKRLVFAFCAKLFYGLESFFLPNQIDRLSYDKPVRILTPTYDGSGQAVHPDILPLDDSQYAFALAFTPYPFTDDRHENPSILVSKDGLHFREEGPRVNPLASAPAVDHNDDPDLFLYGGSYYMLYLETMRPERQNLALLRSEDRLTWSRATVATYELRGAEARPMIVSPAIVRHGCRLRMFYVNATEPPYRIEYLESDRVDSWDIGAARQPRFDSMPFVPWHLDVVEGPGVFYMLITAVRKGNNGKLEYDLHVARSNDLEYWAVAPRPVFPRMPLGARLVYRSTAYCSGRDLFIYFSYKSRFGEWKIGLVRKRVADLFE